ncbi:hypothetical protein BGV54_05905 [Burkholderia ubonensis]|uniref:hypothetical protein n=1 Tax=Burkholderia ubonensis TaxID=101571 RepID=UPI0008FE4777|nr:hypothetical protein [Burkholderia ubonensis]OJB25291.1 hypothetical protein BGV54_05905 [Burkholderia ubonensis]
MLKASEPNIMPIRDLDIYYRCHTRDTTSLSIHIDGLTIYTLDIRGVLSPESGTDTVGAFSSDDKRSLVAWIDPKTGTFISSDSTFYDSLLGIPVLALMIVCAAALLGLAGWVVAALLGIAVFLAVRRAVEGRTNAAELESLLREQSRKDG